MNTRGFVQCREECLSEPHFSFASVNSNPQLDDLNDEIESPWSFDLEDRH